jgi:hypothetical protein
MLTSATAAPAALVGVTWDNDYGDLCLITAIVPTSDGGTRTLWIGGTAAGPYFVELTEVADSGVPSDFPLGIQPVFCIDLYQPVGGSNVLYEIDSLVGSPAGGSPDVIVTEAKANALSWLFATRYSLAGVQGTVEADAFTAAVWEILYDTPGPDNSLDVGILNNGTTGFRVDSTTGRWGGPDGAIATANRWLLDVDYLTEYPGLYALRSATYQDLCIVGGFGDDLVQPVPEPGSAVILIGLGAILGLARLRRWRRGA